MNNLSTLNRFHLYDREAIAKHFAPSYSFTASTGSWGISGIVSVPDSKDVVFIENRVKLKRD